MSKIYAFVIIVPMIAVLMFKAVFIYEYDTKQRYIKDLVDAAAYKVKITGVFSQDDYDEIRVRLNKIAAFKDLPGKTCIVLKKGKYRDGLLEHMEEYTPGEQLEKGDAFSIFVRSSEVSNFSRIQNGGISLDDAQNLYYQAKAQCRVEYVGD